MNIVPVEVWSVPMNRGNMIDVRLKAGLFHIARILSKPILYIPDAQFTHMGIKMEEKTYAAYVVLDGGIMYLYKEKVKEGSHGKKE